MPEPAPVTTAMWFWRRGMDAVSSVFGFEHSMQTNSKWRERKWKALPLRCSHSAWRCPKERHLAEWKRSVERIWSAPAPDYGEAACLVRGARCADAGEMSERVYHFRRLRHIFWR